MALERGEFGGLHRIPDADANGATDEEKAAFPERQEPLSRGHTLEDLIGGQTMAGFAMTGFYEDLLPELKLSQQISSCVANRARKIGSLWQVLKRSLRCDNCVSVPT